METSQFSGETFAHRRLHRKGVRAVLKTSYENGKPVRCAPLRLLVLTKRDRFYRVEGKIISRSFAIELIRRGWVQPAT